MTAKAKTYWRGGGRHYVGQSEYSGHHGPEWVAPPRHPAFRPSARRSSTVQTSMAQYTDAELERFAQHPNETLANKARFELERRRTSP